MNLLLKLENLLQFLMTGNGYLDIKYLKIYSINPYINNILLV